MHGINNSHKSAPYPPSAAKPQLKQQGCHRFLPETVILRFDHTTLNPTNSLLGIVFITTLCPLGCSVLLEESPLSENKASYLLPSIYPYLEILPSAIC
jgi:hypothetical protein